MGATARVMIDPETVSVAVAIRTAAEAVPMLVIQQRALVDLAAELGGMDGAVGFLVDLAGEIGRPLAVNVETGADTSSTAFLAPRSWNAERLQGWVATRHGELEAEFGAVTRVGVGPGV